MLTSDPNMRILFLVFLLVFLLVGLVPFFQETFSKIAEYFASFGKFEEPSGAGSKYEAGERVAQPHESPALYEFEAIVLARLAQAGGKNLSLKALARDLHVDPLLLDKSLEALGARGLVRSPRTVLGGRRLYLSHKGREYAIDQGLLPRPQARYRGKGR